MSDDIRVPRDLLMDVCHLIEGRKFVSSRRAETAKRTIETIAALLAAPPATPRPGYVKCANPECANTFGGYGYGEWPKVCPDCQDKGIEPPAAQPTGDGARLVSALNTMADQFDCMHPDVIKTTLIQAANWIARHSLDTQTAQPDRKGS